MKNIAIKNCNGATLPRRSFIRGMALTAAGIFLLPLAVSGAPARAATPGDKTAAISGKKPLVVYFSHSGNTKKVAEDIHRLVGGDIVRIEPVNPYPEDYHQTTDQAKAEQRENARPAIKTKISNLDEYGIIFLGYPNWWSSMPMPVYTFVEENGLDGRTIAPFDTHGGGGLGHSVEDLKKIAPHAKILKPLAIRGTAASRAGQDVKKWLEGLGTALIETTTGNPAIYPDGAY